MNSSSVQQCLIVPFELLWWTIKLAQGHCFLWLSPGKRLVKETADEGKKKQAAEARERRKGGESEHVPSCDFNRPAPAVKACKPWKPLGRRNSLICFSRPIFGLDEIYGSTPSSRKTRLEQTLQAWLIKTDLVN